MKNKLINLLLLFLLVVILLCSCVDDNKTQPNDTTVTPQTDNQQERTFIIKEEGGLLNVAVVRPELALVGSESISSARKICDNIQEDLGVKPTFKTDFIHSNENYNSESFEILVGNTAYSESTQATEGFNYGDYRIKVVGNKIVLIGYCDGALEKAASKLLEIFRAGYNAETNSYTVNSRDLDVNATVNSTLSFLPLVDDCEFLSFYDAGIREVNATCHQVILKGATAEAYDKYQLKLESVGFTQYTTNNIAPNKFSVYTNSEYTINLGYYDYEGYIRLLIEPSAPLSGLEPNPEYTKVTTSQLTMLGVAVPLSTNPYGVITNGLSMLIRLEDGRFIVIDGGPVAANWQPMLNVMREQSKDYTSNPVIAAWIITHAHGDHIAMLKNSTATIKANGIKVERFFFNLMSDSVYSQLTGDDSAEGEQEPIGTKSAFTSMMAQMRNTFGSEIYKPHTGQRYTFANCKIDVLYTLESYAPNKCETMNTSSIILKMTFKDSASGIETVYMSTGDATGKGMNFITKTFGDYIKSDIIQVNHHGFACGTGADQAMRTAYEKITPALVLIPNGSRGSVDAAIQSFTFTQQLFKNSEFRECYFAGKNGEYITVSLPYIYGGNCISGTITNKLR